MGDTAKTNRTSAVPGVCGPAVLGWALGLGLAGDLMLRPLPWGLNVLLWIAGLAAAVTLIDRRPAARPTDRWLLLPLLLFAAGFTWRDSPTLKMLDLLALVSLLTLMVLSRRGVRLTRAGLAECLGALGRTIAHAGLGSGRLLCHEIPWKAATGGREGRGIALGRGLFFAAPLLLLFASLLASADPVFAHFLGRIVQLQTADLQSHLCLTAVVAWLTGGFLRGLLLPAAPAVPAPTPAAALGRIETGVILGLLNFLFGCFVLIQIRYFFGGAHLVQATVGLTYADYARRGFFELVWVAALVLPLLLGLHWLQRPDDRRAQELFRGLAGLQIVLLFVIMASALLRMRLYQGQYGLTELRLYTTSFMAWLALVFVWFTATVLRGQRERFTWGALVAALVVIGALHLLNPDEAIVRVNAARVRAGRPFDAGYALSLSADAVPALAAALPSLSPADRATVTAGLAARRRTPERDWRVWSWARARAWQAAGVTGQTGRGRNVR